MLDLKKAAGTTALVLFGGILYTGLNWIPVLGPLAVGFIVGYRIKGSPSEGFRTGIYSASIGTILIALLLSEIGLFSTPETATIAVILITWILFIWNLVGILLAGLGGIAGSLAAQAKKMFGAIAPGIATIPLNISLGIPKPRSVLRLRPPHTSQQEKHTSDAENRIRFAICPHCGSSNPEQNPSCETCGGKLK
ncbi:MAG: zinc ribbon domain-containing protein [Candidatus Altiarchaeota archaeon]